VGGTAAARLPLLPGVCLTGQIPQSRTKVPEEPLCHGFLMSDLNFEDQEKDEIARSAAQAARLSEEIVAQPGVIERYRNPPSTTHFPLEYAFSLLGKIENKSSLRILDYGCGPGENTVVLAARGAHVIGIDISPELVAIAQKRVKAYNLSADVMVGSASKTGLPANSVDVVFGIAVFHHLDLAAAKQELRRILRPAGVLILQEPVCDSPQLRRIRSLFPDRDEISSFERPLTGEQLDFLSSGFQCISARRFRLPFVAVVRKFAKKLVRSSWALDGWLLKTFPALARFATIEVRMLALEND